MLVQKLMEQQSSIDVLNEKINALAVNSHNDNAIMISALNNFPTADEVNTGLDELKKYG